MIRINAICSCLESVSVVADVGCDHGLVAKYCADSKKFNKVIASDISDECLKKARVLLHNRSNVEFVVCDGIGYTCDEAVIAGMGGMTVCDILNDANRNERLPDILVLSPQRDTDCVRRILTDLGYVIDVDRMVKDRNKFYTIIRAKKSEDRVKLTELQYLFGVNVYTQNDVLSEYLQKMYDTYVKIPNYNAKKMQAVTQALKLQGVTINKN